jgi:hypothetical protein
MDHMNVLKKSYGYPGVSTCANAYHHIPSVPFQTTQYCDRIVLSWREATVLFSALPLLRPSDHHKSCTSRDLSHDPIIGTKDVTIKLTKLNSRDVIQLRLTAGLFKYSGTMA